MVCANEPRQARERRPLDLDAGALHLGKHGRQRPLQRLIDRGDGFGRKPRLEHEPEPEADIGLLAGIFGGARHRDAVEADGIAAGAHAPLSR